MWKVQLDFDGKYTLQFCLACVRPCDFHIDVIKNCAIHRKSSLVYRSIIDITIIYFNVFGFEMWDKDRHALDNFWNCSAALEVFVWTLRDVIFQETVEPPCELWKLGTLLWYEIAWPMYPSEHLMWK